MSSHLTNIPEAVRIAASTDPSVDPQLKLQAIEYLQKVKELSEETWQVHIQFLQGCRVTGHADVIGLLGSLPSRSRCCWTLQQWEGWKGEAGK
jgi:exportin-T